MRAGRVTLMAAALILGACATLTQKLEPPRVALAGMRISRADLFEQRYALKLRIQNPNDVPLAIRGMSYDVELNDKPFAYGVSNTPVQVPAFGEGVANVEVTSNLLKTFRQFRDIAEGGTPRLEYRIRGAMKLDGWPGRLPFEYQGELAPPAKAGRGPAGSARGL